MSCYRCPVGAYIRVVCGLSSDFWLSRPEQNCRVVRLRWFRQYLQHFWKTTGIRANTASRGLSEILEAFLPCASIRWDEFDCAQEACDLQSLPMLYGSFAFLLRSHQSASLPTPSRCAKWKVERCLTTCAWKKAPVARQQGARVVFYFCFFQVYIYVYVYMYEFMYVNKTYIIAR